MNEVDQSLQEYLINNVGESISDLGNFIQFTIKKAYLAGYSDALDGLKPKKAHIVEYKHKVTASTYRRGVNGTYHTIQEMDGNDLPFVGWDKSHFSENEFVITEVCNDKGMLITADHVEYKINGEWLQVYSFLEKADGVILASAGPFLKDYLSNPATKMKIQMIDVNQIQE